MRHIPFRLLAASSLLVAGAALAATRPHYGGVLRVEIREAVESADPPAVGRSFAELTQAFTIARWEAGRRAVYQANESAPGGRPFLDSIDIQMGRSVRDQSIDLELGKADLVELELRRPAPGRKVWSSSPIRVVVLVFGARVDDARLREALALSVDRVAIHNVLLQRQGEISGALLPQWLSGLAFLFPTATDVARARALVSGLPAARSLTIGVDNPAFQPLASRIALNARDAGLQLTPAVVNATADVRLLEAWITSTDPARALAGVASSLGLPEPARSDSPEAVYAAERALLEGYRVIPLFHLPEVYGVGPRVKGGPAITPLGEWRFENLWVEGARP